MSKNLRANKKAEGGHTHTEREDVKDSSEGDEEMEERGQSRSTSHDEISGDNTLGNFEEEGT